MQLLDSIVTPKLLGLLYYLLLVLELVVHYDRRLPFFFFEL